MKILVVEDDALIGMDLVMMLEDWGHVAQGPHGTADDALRAVEADLPDLALLDVNLGEAGTSVAVAEALHGRGIPFVFLTGYNRSRCAVSAPLAEAPVLSKPVDHAELRRLLDALAARTQETPGPSCAAAD